MKKQGLIIGLDCFGGSVAEGLTSHYNIIGVEKEEEIAGIYKNILERVVICDITEKDNLEKLMGSHFDFALVNIGRKDSDKNIYVVRRLSKYRKQEPPQIGRLMTRAWNREQKRTYDDIYTELGVDDIILPDDLAAHRIIEDLVLPSKIKPANLSRYGIPVDFPPPEGWVGHSIRELEIAKKGIIIIGIEQEDEFKLIPDPDYRFGGGERIIAIGNEEDLIRIYQKDGHKEPAIKKLLSRILHSK